MNQLYYLSDDQRAIRDLARQIARERIAPLAARVDETGEYPHEQLKLLAQQGLMGLHIPEEYGGSGAGALAFCLAAEEVAWACAATSTIFLVQNLGGYPITLAGNEEQKRRFLPRLATGGRHYASVRPSIRHFSAGLASARCKPMRPRRGHGTAALSTSARSKPNVS